MDITNGRGRELKLSLPTSALRQTGTASLGLVLAGAVILRLLHLGSPSLWLDEARSVYVAESYPLAEIVTGPLLKDYHHLWNLFLWGWVRLTGDSELAVRLPAVLFGVLAILGLYRLARRLFDQRVALLAAGLASCHALAVGYSQEARTYALTLALAVLAAHLVARVLWEEETRLGSWMALAIVLAALPYSHYYAILLVVAFNLAFAVVWWRRRKNLLPWLIVQLPTLWVVLHFMPGALSEHEQLLQAVGWKFWVTRDPLQNTVAWLLSFSGGLPADILDANGLALALGGCAVLGASGLIGLALTGLWRVSAPEREPLFFVASAALVPPLLTIGASWLVMPLFSVYLVRYVLYCSPFWWLLVAIGLEHALFARPARLRALASAALALFLLIGALANWNLAYGYTTRMPRSADFRGLAADLRARSQPQDLVVHTSYFSYFSVWYYLRDARPQLALFGTQWERWLPNHLSALAVELPAIVRDWGYRRVWVVAFYDWEKAPHTGDEWRIDLAVRRTMPADFVLLDRRHFNDVDLYLYDVAGVGRQAMLDKDD